MKKLYTIIVSITICLSNYASVTLDGTFLNDATDLSDGEQGALLIDKSNVGWVNIGTGSNPGDIQAGLSSFDNATYNSDFEFIDQSDVFIGFPNPSWGGNYSFNLVNGVDTGDQFGVLVYENSQATTNNGDSYKLWTDTNWLLPADGNTITAGTDFDQLSGANSFSGNVVPEPSSYAILMGIIVCGAVIIRQRLKAST